MNDWAYDILDHKWDNLKKWVEGCENKFGKEGLIKISRMGDMMRTIQEMSDTSDDIILKAILDEKK